MPLMRLACGFPQLLTSGDEKVLNLSLKGFRKFDKYDHESGRRELQIFDAQVHVYSGVICAFALQQRPAWNRWG